MHNKFIQDILLGNPWKIIDHIADDLSNTKLGYSFVNNPWNHKFYNWKLFLTLIMDSPRLWDEFVIVIVEDSTPLMNLGQVRRWLNDYADGLLFLIAVIKILAESPSWDTELTYIQLRNISCWTWVLYNIGCCMAIIVQYSKTSTKNGHNTLIPHILDVFCQDIIKTVTFVTHPFTGQMSWILYLDCNDITVLWHNQLFVKNNCLLQISHQYCDMPVSRQCKYNWEWEITISCLFVFNILPILP